MTSIKLLIILKVQNTIVNAAVKDLSSAFEDIYVWPNSTRFLLVMEIGLTLWTVLAVGSYVPRYGTTAPSDLLIGTSHL